MDTASEPAARFRPAVPDADVCGRYGQFGRRRDEYFASLVLEDLWCATPNDHVTVLDIGCGGGFHHRLDLQAAIGKQAKRFLGVEPDKAATLQPVFSQSWRYPFEECPIPPASVDLAYAVMVLEHVEKPEQFFERLASVMRPGGVFWGFTVDRRHWFAWLSALLAQVHMKDRYLTLLHGKKGVDRYENFPTAYRCNSPQSIKRLASNAFDIQTWSLHRVGQVDFYLPRILRPLARFVDRITLALGLPGSVLVMRLRKK